jgi:hypothetical protein
MLARHLNRLSDTLQSFGTRLREAVASAVGETVAAVVQETFHALLADVPGRPTIPRDFGQHRGTSQPLWARPDDPQDEPWFDDQGHFAREEYEDDRPHTGGIPSASRVSRSAQAVAIGLHTTLCWLRRRVGRYPVLIALGVGLLTALGTFAGGPLAAAAVSLAGSAFSLMSLAETMHTGADAMSAFGPS